MLWDIDKGKMVVIALINDQKNLGEVIESTGKNERGIVGSETAEGNGETEIEDYSDVEKEGDESARGGLQF